MKGHEGQAESAPNPQTMSQVTKSRQEVFVCSNAIGTATDARK